MCSLVVGRCYFEYVLPCRISMSKVEDIVAMLPNLLCAAILIFSRVMSGFSLTSRSGRGRKLYDHFAAKRNEATDELERASSFSHRHPQSALICNPGGLIGSSGKL